MPILIVKIDPHERLCSCNRCLCCNQRATWRLHAAPCASWPLCDDCATKVHQVTTPNNRVEDVNDEHPNGATKAG